MQLAVCRSNSSMTAAAVVRFGTRGSALARAQTDLVIARFRALYPEIRATSVVIQTEGDRDKTSSLTVIGGRGVFTTALQDALRAGEIDAAVHSAKDLPTESPSDLHIAAFLERTDPRDVFISKHKRPLSDLPPNPLIGTSSRRRGVQVLKLRPDARIMDLRGNVDTRLRKAIETELDGIVLAAAGVQRMGWSDQITEFLPLEIAVPSPGQGALAVEIRRGEVGPASLLAELDEPLVSTAVRTERAFLRGMGGGCTSPVGAFATVEGDLVHLRAMLGTTDGSRVEWVEERYPTERAELSAEASAMKLLTSLTASPTLSGKRILVTCGGADDHLAFGLRACGADVTVSTLTRIEFPDHRELTQTMSKMENRKFDWVVFSSQNAVEGFFRARESSKLLAGAAVSAVGSVTAAKLESRGVTVDLQPANYNGAALVEEIRSRDLRDKAVLFPHGNLARRTIPDGLRALGANVQTVEVYRTVPAETLDSDVASDLIEGAYDLVVFCAPSSVATLSTLLREQGKALHGTTAACIGPTTSEAAREVGLIVEVQPSEATIESLIEAIESYFAKIETVLPVLLGGARSNIGGHEE